MNNDFKFGGDTGIPYGERAIGSCGRCGGPVTVPAAHHNTIPPIPTCCNCGAIANSEHHGPTIPMGPAPGEYVEHAGAGTSVEHECPKRPSPYEVESRRYTHRQYQAIANAWVQEYYGDLISEDPELFFLKFGEAVSFVDFMWDFNLQDLKGEDKC